MTDDAKARALADFNAFIEQLNDGHPHIRYPTVQTIRAALSVGDEPVAWQNIFYHDDGRIVYGASWPSKEAAELSAGKRNSGSSIRPLYAAPVGHSVDKETKKD